MNTIITRKATRKFVKRVWLFFAGLVFFTVANAGGTGGGITDVHGVVLTGTVADPVRNTQPLGIGQVLVMDYTNLGMPVQSTQTDKKIKNIITFSLIEGSLPNPATPIPYISQDFSATITVQIEYGHDAGTLNTTTQTFTVDYKKAEGVKYNAKKYFSFDNAEYVRVTILSTSYNIPTVGSLDTRNILMLENQMQVTRYFELPLTVPQPAAFTFTAPAVTTPDHLTATWAWPLNTGNNATQLEWNWIEDEVQENYKVGGVLNNDLIFKNATRIDLPLDKLQYDIPLLYDGIGKLYFRIRAVNIKEAGGRSEGPWVQPQVFSFGGHNNKLNWQSTTTFAEEGKRKTVIQYYDGSLRGRQTVTKDNTTDKIVVAETFYDGQGRPAIQILPTPGITDIIKYQANLNLFNGQVADQDPAELFDMEPVATPNSFTPLLQTSTGTSLYYSPANTTGNPNIPDAEGYPYTVTRYTPDATGRVMMQSGLGVAHKMGNGHETKYYYGTAAQEELDGLFGTEVGNYTHYAKNMVRDANGQMSISYVDMQGRTIATALAGNTTTNLVSLDKNNPVNYPNQAGTNITRNLLDNSTNNVKGNTIESVSSLLVPAANLYTFRYELNPQTLQLAACSGASPATLCYDCLYDLEIAITDESGLTAPIIKKYSNVSLNPDDNCSTPIQAFKDVATNNVSNVIVIPNLSLQIGSYSIRKTLTVSQSSFQYYKELYISKALCKTEQQIIDSIYNVLLTTSNCANTTPVTCQSCLSSLGTEADFRTNYINSIGLNPQNQNPAPAVSAAIENEIHAAYQQQYQNCNKLCNTVSQSLPTIRELMLLDMVPYSGQYAKEDASENTVSGVHTMFDKYNVFSTVNTSTQPFYKNPWNSNKVKDFYYDDVNNKDRTIHSEMAPVPDYTVLNATSSSGFEGLFKSSWANALLPHHPEYDRLVFAENNLASSYNWINAFTQADDFSTAQTNGYLNSLANDPFFVQAPSYASLMTNNFSNYQGMGVGIWQLAYGEVACKSIVNISQRQSCYTAAPNTPPPYSGFTAAENDRAWQIFRGLYAAQRNSFVDEYIANSIPLQSVTDEDDLITQHFKLWFPKNNQQVATQSDWSWWPTTIGGGPTGINPNPLPTTYNDRCSSYINTWKTKLLQCASLASNPNKDAILSEITTRMQAVCVNGSNPSNPYGSSNVAPGTPASVTDRSFEDVIKNVFIQYGIINASGVYADIYCNPFVIDWPKPYGKGPKMYEGEKTGIIDSCNCKQYGTIARDAVANGVNITNLNLFNQYLFNKYGDSLTTAMFAGLQHCSDISQITCVTKDTTIGYNCNNAPPPCPMYKMSSAANKSTEKSPSTSAANIVNGGGAAYTCKELTNLIAAFHAAYGYPTGTNCQNLFVQYFNNQYGTSYTWAQLVTIYQNACNSDLNVCAPAFTCTDINNLIAQFHATYGYPYGFKCQNNFTNYFNAYYGTSYTWADIVTIYSNTCGGTLDVCSPCLITCSSTICDTVYAGGYYVLPVAQPLPDFLKCGYEYNPKCITCAGLSSLTAEYKSIFTPQPNTAPIFTGTNLTPAQVQYNMNFARFINYRTGFQYGWRDYAQAAVNASPSCNLDNYPSNTGATQNVICGSARPLADTITIPHETPCEKVYRMSIVLGQQIYQIRRQTLLKEFGENYNAKCLAAKDIEQFTVAYATSEYHYTLYYYDMAGNLVKTVPPKGVRPDFSTSNTTQVELDKGNDVFNPRPHQFITEYRYNSLNQVVSQKTPDAGISNFWYDALGRLVVSQNAQQAVDNNYSYTKYDALGRIKEVGQKPQTAGSMSQLVSQDATALTNWMDNSGGTKNQITRTTYDVIATNINPPPAPALLTQQNLRNRISYTQLFDTDPGAEPDFVNHKNASYYTYDEHGNVYKLLQDYKGIAAMSNSGNRFKLLQYDYDLVSGKVNMVSYQPDFADAFYHKYKYDAENRITEVLTSRDKIVWENDARYNYYKHGPLARTELGQLNVQGTDYSYTIQGWLKGVNNTALNPALDIAGDGTTATSAAKDVLSLGLHYFDEMVNGNAFMDYKPIGTTSAFARPGTAANMVSLYNGNIAAMSVNNAGLAKNTASGNNSLPLLYNYRYDQLNRIVSMQAYKGLDAATNQWNALSITDYKEDITYDPNGNISTYQRNGDAARGLMDDLVYGYKPNANQLDKVYDAAADASGYNDIKRMQPDGSAGQQNGNYTYDAIGNMIGDASEGITNIAWTVYGKIQSITKATGTINYTYDMGGNRVSKTIGFNTTTYIRDASGNVMALYEGNNQTGSLVLKENYLYGSTRIGIANQLTLQPQTVTVAGGFGTGILSTFTRGEKLFELGNHLGNVLVTISDKKIQHTANNQSVDYYNTDIMNAVDYAPFGALLTNRKYSLSSSSYRYGFNGKENDNEVKGEGNQQDYGMRIFDPRLGRFLSVDPLSGKFPFYTPYQFAGNCPILAVDIDGLEGDVNVNKTEEAPTTTGSIRYQNYSKKDNGQEANTDISGVPVNGGQVVFGKNAIVGFINIGTEKVQDWRVYEFKTENGDWYQWNQEKKWFVNIKNGKDFSQAFYHDIASWGMRQFGEPMSKAMQNILEGHPFSDTRQAYQEFLKKGGSGGMFGFVYNGVKDGLSEWKSDMNAGGHRQIMATISMWQFSRDVAAGFALSAKIRPDLGNKLEFLFGKATGRLHNLQRTASMLRSLNKIGIFDNSFGRSYVAAHIKQVFANPASIASVVDGFVTRESLLSGPNGLLKLETVWKGSKLISAVTIVK